MHVLGFTARPEMSLHETDREDLFAECTALVRRIELLVPGEPEPVVAGRRENGAWSIYFGKDPVYHFDEQGRLRRAFAGGALYRTQGHTLARLERKRSRQQVVLVRNDLSRGDLDQFLLRMQQQVGRLQDSLRAGELKCGRSFPEAVDVAGPLRSGLATVLAAWPNLAPAIPTRST